MCPICPSLCYLLVSAAQPEAQLVQMSAQQAPTVTSIPAARISITDGLCKSRTSGPMKNHITSPSDLETLPEGSASLGASKSANRSRNELRQVQNNHLKFASACLDATPNAGRRDRETQLFEREMKAISAIKWTELRAVQDTTGSPTT